MGEEGFERRMSRRGATAVEYEEVTRVWCYLY
jgi:hypothetical protein